MTTTDASENDARMYGLAGLKCVVHQCSATKQMTNDGRQEGT